MRIIIHPASCFLHRPIEYATSYCTLESSVLYLAHILACKRLDIVTEEFGMACLCLWTPIQDKPRAFALSMRLVALMPLGFTPFSILQIWWAAIYCRASTLELHNACYQAVYMVKQY